VNGTIGIGILGFGFMGRTHAAGYERARLAGAPCELRAISSRHQPRTTGRDSLDALGDPLPFDPLSLRRYDEPDALLESEDIDAVSICTWTDTHVELASRALAAGKHALIEKPLALRVDPIMALARTVERSGLLCAPAMCLRYWPGWPWLHERIREGTFGAVRSAVFQRLGETPRWATEFYSDASLSGGALFDLHVHDVDFLRWCFGEPTAVSATGNAAHVTTLYHFAGTPAHVTAEGGWIDAHGFGFHMKYLVEFDEAVAEFELARDPRNARLRLMRHGRREAVPLPRASPYDAEVCDFVEAIAAGHNTVRATVADAIAVTRILEAEQQSLGSGTTVRLAP
jgi:predicted dehydrogenase